VTQNSAGAVHWERLWAATDGELLTIGIPAEFNARHTPYLEEVIENRVLDLFGGAAIGYRLDAGRIEIDDGQLHYAELGEFIFTGLSQPWPDPEPIRHSLAEALKEAGEIELEQTRLAESLRRHMLGAA
jgi:hypothetical protein